MSSDEKFKNLRVEAEDALTGLKSKHLLSGEVEDQLKKLLHELQVHQLELEMQNEELTRVQNLLEREKNKYTDLFEYSPLGYILLNKDGKIKETNQTFCKILGLPKSSVINKTFSSFVGQESQDELYLHIRSVIEKKDPQTCVLQLESKLGQPLWVRLESKACNFKHEGTLTIQASVSDITTGKINEEHMLRLSTAFEQSSNSIVITDTNGLIQYANPRFYETTGFTPEEVIGKNPRIVKYENSEINYHEMWQTIKGGDTWIGEFLNKTKRGDLFWEIATITPVKNSEGKIINYLAIKENITKRKLAEKKLQKAKDFYLKLLEDFPLMVWQCDTRGKFNFFNRTFTEFTGKVFRDPSKQLLANLILEKDRKVFLDAFEMSLKKKMPFVVEYRMKDRYDNYRWVLNHGTPFTDMEGNYGGFIATCIDIHDRRIMEERLIESEDRYRRMFEDSSLGIFKLDRSLTFVNANKAFAEMLGYENTVDFLIDINNNPTKFFPEFSKEKELGRRLVRSKENRFVLEKELYRKDGSKMYALIHLRKVYERSRDKQFYMEGFIEDVTSRKLAERKLVFSEQKFKSLFEKSYEAILMLDNSKVVDCNRKASELFGLDGGKLLFKTIADLSPEKQDDLQDTQQMFRQKISLAMQGDAQTFECLMLRNGKAFHAEVSFARIFLRNKYMIQAIVRDVSEKKLAEKQLKQARDDAEKARMAQSEFLSLMSHEIRTPLNAVVSLTDLMLHEQLNPDHRENLDTIKVSARHLLGLIDDILDYNKIESGNIQFVEEPFEIRTLVEQLRKVLMVKAREKNLTLVTDIGENVPETLKADTLRLKQVLFNMLSNAIKFTEEGSVSLKIEKPDPESDMIHFEVRDTGIGIAADRLEAIFEKFTQEKYSTTRKYGGSGLGLTICKKLVELQGGTIKARSKPGKGSVFQFFIPMEEATTVEREQATIPETRNQYVLKGVRILLVEDDKMNQFVVQKVVGKKWKASLEIAPNAEEAIQLLSEKTFDLVLMDILLPQMDGYDLARYIRSNQNGAIKNPAIPILALTADAFVETRKKALDAGMNDFISKPFDYDNLFKMISQYSGTY